MRNFLVVLIFLIFPLSAAGYVECQERKVLIKNLNYRQREFFDQWRYLSSKETKVAQELNGEIKVYNEDPSLLTLQKIEDLKVKVIENLQDQIKNDRDYVSYLELRLAELLDQRFIPLMLKKDRGQGGEPLRNFEASKEASVSRPKSEPALPKATVSRADMKEAEEVGLKAEVDLEEPEGPGEDEIEELMDEIMLNIKGLKRR